MTQLPRRHARAGRRVDRLRARVRRSDPRAGAAAATRCWAPTASAAATRARTCASFFEVNRFYVTVAALKALADDGEVPAAKVAEAIKKYGLDAEKPAPWTV